LEIGEKARALARVRRFIESEKRIPQLPQILVRIESALDDPTVGGKELARVILDDPALTAQVLKVANSTFYNPAGQRIKTVSRAIVILGFENIRRLVLGFNVSRLMALLPEHPVYRRLWRHSLAVALFARDLARLDGCDEVEAVFVAGLLHDVGKFILGHLHGEAYIELLERHVCEIDFDFCRAEREAFSCNHQEVGAMLAHAWGLPRDLIRVISRHQSGPDWRELSEALPGGRSYVILANRMARVLELQNGDGDDEFSFHLRRLVQPARRCLGLEEEVFVALFVDINEKILATAAYFDIRLDDLCCPVGNELDPPVVAREIDEARLLEISMRISEMAVQGLTFSAYVEATAGVLAMALGLELLLLYLPGSKGRGLAPAVCFGGGLVADSFKRLALSVEEEGLVNRVFNEGVVMDSGAPPVGSLDARMRELYWNPGRLLALPLQSPGGSGASGVLLVLRNCRTRPFTVQEQRLLKLYAGLLASRLSLSPKKQ